MQLNSQAVSKHTHIPPASDVQLTSQTVSRYTCIPPASLDNNMVNICYMNSVLQVLYYIPEVAERLDFCSLTNMDNQQLRAVNNIFNEMSSSSVVVTASHFSMLRGVKTHWLLGQQQDACDFINDIIGNLYGKQKSSDSNLISSCHFSILMRTALNCTGCNRCSTCEERCGALKIPMANGSSRTSIQELIDDNTHIVDNIDYNCNDNNSNQQCQATESIKTDDIITVSKYVIVQLGIFSFDHHGSKFQRPLELNCQIQICYVLWNSV